MKFNEKLTKLVKNDLSVNLIPMLLGEPGIGKSSWVESLAEEMGTKCFTLACNQLADKADLTGARLVPVTDENGKTTSYKQVFYPHAVIHDAIEYAIEHPKETPILFMDEINRTTPDVTSEALSIPTMRAIGSSRLPDNLAIITAGNDKGNITSLDEASVSRFVPYTVTPDTDTFLNLDPELNAFVKKVLTQHPDCIFCKSNGMAAATVTDDNGEESETFIDDILDDGDSMTQFTTPRTITGVSRWLNTLSNRDLLDMLGDVTIVGDQEVSLLQEALEAHIGPTKFCAYLLSEIAVSIMSADNDMNQPRIVKPTKYDDLKKFAATASTLDAVSDYIETNLDQPDRSACLLYSLYEREDNTTIIKTLSPLTSSLLSKDTKVLFGLLASDNLDERNVQIFLKTKSDVANALSPIFTAQL